MISEKNQQVRFWNGNKTVTRREYETQLLSLCLQEAGVNDAKLIVDETDYPRAEDEGNIFSGNCDALVSVAGNQKFSGKAIKVIEIPICRGVLGHRLLIISQQRAQAFAEVQRLEQLKALTIGIPATWADAEVFRKNDCAVLERGSLNDIFQHLVHQECDYIALGANEIEAIFAEYKLADLGLMIVPNVLIYYPLPLVFYVHPAKHELACVIERGLKRAIKNGKHATLFEKHHPNLTHRLELVNRKRFVLNNPYLSAGLAGYSSELV